MHKYDLHEVYETNFKNFEAMVVKAQRLPRPDETLTVDLPVFFLFHLEHENWYLIKGPTPKNYNIGIKHVFSRINIRQVPWEVLKTEAGGPGFQHLPWDLANVNALKTMFDRYYCIHFL